MELLRMKPPVFAGHLDGVGFIGPEQPKMEVFEEEPRVVVVAKAPDVPVLLELAISQSGRMGPVGILGQTLDAALDLPLQVPAEKLRLRLGLGRSLRRGPQQEEHYQESSRHPYGARHPHGAHAPPPNVSA